jgi:hypothetical protein
VGCAASIRSRRSQHFSRLRRGFHHSRPLQQDFKKFGEAAFIFEILDENGNEEIEKAYIAKFNAMHPNGYNIREPTKPSYRISCEWNGNQYRSIREAAHDNDIYEHTLNLWIKKGYTCDADVPQKTLHQQRKEIQAWRDHLASFVNKKKD